MLSNKFNKQEVIKFVQENGYEACFEYTIGEQQFRFYEFRTLKKHEYIFITSPRIRDAAAVTFDTDKKAIEYIKALECDNFLFVGDIAALFENDRERLAYSRMLQPKDYGYQGNVTYGEKAINPRIAREEIKQNWKLETTAIYNESLLDSFLKKKSAKAYEHHAIKIREAIWQDAYIQELNPDCNYTLIKHPESEDVYALPLSIDELLRKEKGELTISLYRYAELRAVIINVGTAECLLRNDEYPVWIKIESVNPFSGDEPQYEKPIAAYGKLLKNQEHFLAIASNGAQMATNRLSILFYGNWSEVPNNEKLTVTGNHEQKLKTIMTAANIKHFTLPKKTKPVLSLTFTAQAVRLLQKNAKAGNDYTATMLKNGIMLYSAERGDLMIEAATSEGECPKVELPLETIQKLQTFVASSKRSEETYRLFVYPEKDLNCYTIRIGNDQYTLQTSVRYIENKTTKAIEEAAQKHTKQIVFANHNDRVEHEQKLREGEERKRLISEAQARIKAEEAAALAERIKSEQAEVARIKAEEAKTQSPADNGNIIAVIEEHDITDITPTFTAPSILDEFEDTAIVPVSNPLPAVIEAKPARIDYLQDDNALANLLAALAQIAGINVMLVGTWLWIDGDTKPVKEQLKQLGFRWHQKKVMWFMSLDQKYHKTRHNADWATIAMRYGVRTLKTND